MLLSGIRVMALTVIVILTPMGAIAQTSASPAASTTVRPLSAAELDQLVAPIALYPDPLLAEVLMASAYPLEIVQAERWLQTNKNLQEDQLKSAVDKQPWDESIILLGHLANGLGFYRFSFKGSNTLYVGVIAQEVQQLTPQAVTRGRDGYLLVYYERLGLKFETYNQWIKSGAQIPVKVRIQ